MNLTVGQEVDGLEILQTVDSSRRGSSYKVRDTVTQRIEYLKRLPVRQTDDDDSAERFMREARLHAGLSHPNIAQFYSVRHVGGDLVMTREWVDGEPLSVRLQNGPLDVLRAVDYIGQVLDALTYAHSRGVVHRNVNADNLLIAENGIVKLVGFELARANSDPKLTQVGVRLGSAHYMAPEQVKGLIHADERSDIYAVGVVLYEALTGRKPFEGMRQFEVMQAQVQTPVEPPSSRNDMVGDKLDQVVMRALEKDRDRRYQTAGEFHAQLIDVVRRCWDSGTPEPVSKPELPAGPPQLDTLPITEIPPSPATFVHANAKRNTDDLSRVLGVAIIGFSVGLLLFLAGMMLLNH